MIAFPDPPNSDARVRQVIEAARQSPNTFVEYVIGVTQGIVHRAIQNHMTDNDLCYMEFHRGMGKTVQMSARCAYEIGRNPDIRINYVQQNIDESRKTVSATRAVIESPRFKQVFPDITPDKRAWGNESFLVQRRLVDRSQTMTARGIIGRAGGRSDILAADDVCDEANAILKPAEREKVKGAWENTWLPTMDFTGGKRAREWKVGTPWHVDDITAKWRKDHGEDGTLLRMPIRGDESPWSEGFPPDRVRFWREKLGPVAFGRAYLLEPVSAEMLIFRREWLEAALYDEIPDDVMKNSRVVSVADMAYSDKAQADYSVFVVARECLFTGALYVVDMLRGKWEFPDFKRRMIAMGRDHDVERCNAEANGPQKGIVQQLNRDAPFPVIGIDRDRDKVTRAIGVQAAVESGRLRLPRDPSSKAPAVSERFSALFDEMVVFPAGEHDDCVDCAIDLLAKTGKSTGGYNVITIGQDKGVSSYYGGRM